MDRLNLYFGARTLPVSRRRQDEPRSSREGCTGFSTPAKVPSLAVSICRVLLISASSSAIFSRTVVTTSSSGTMDRSPPRRSLSSTPPFSSRSGREGQAYRHPDEVGVLELHAEALTPVVVENLYTFDFELFVELGRGVIQRL
jgi:hypothetical protein